MVITYIVSVLLSAFLTLLFLPILGLVGLIDASSFDEFYLAALMLAICYFYRGFGETLSEICLLVLAIIIALCSMVGFLSETFNLVLSGSQVLELGNF